MVNHTSRLRIAGADVYMPILVSAVRVNSQMQKHTPPTLNSLSVCNYLFAVRKLLSFFLLPSPDTRVSGEGDEGNRRRRRLHKALNSNSAICDLIQQGKLVEYVLGVLGINIVLGHHQEASVNVGRDGLFVESDVIGVLDSHVAHVE